MTFGDDSKESALDSSQAVLSLLLMNGCCAPVLGSLHALSHDSFLYHTNRPPPSCRPGLNLGPITRLDPIVL